MPKTSFSALLWKKSFFFTTQHQRGNKSRKTKGGSITLICSQYLCYHVSHSQTCLFSFARIASRQWNVRCADCLKVSRKANRFTVLPCAVIDRFKPTAFVVKSFTVWSGTSAVEWTEKWCSAWELFRKVSLVFVGKKRIEPIPFLKQSFFSCS